MTPPDLLSALKTHFGHGAFRRPQEEIISSIIGGRDTLAIMPTGGGKSLCYQLPAVVKEGVAIVVSPLIALMKDQVDALRARGIEAEMINSSQSWEEQRAALDGLRAGRIKLAYVAPERFRARSFTSALAGAKISLFAIDEAHCISQWGHDFRPDYMRLGEVIESLGRPVCAAFTATATPEVREDILAQLKMREPAVYVSGFERPNLSFNITEYGTKAEKIERVRDIISDYKTGIVYCATRKSVEALSEALWRDGVRHVVYHGGMSAKERDDAQETFISGREGVAVATNAFGMGIDRADLRFVCHFELPGSVEAFYQEAGRAGRDGKAAYCEMLFMYADKRVQEFFIDGANPTADLIRAVYRVVRENADNSNECVMPVDSIAEEVSDILRFEGGSRPRKAASFGRGRGGMSGGANSMAVSGAISILRRLGILERFDAAGSRARGTRLLNPDLEAGAITFPEGALEEKRRRDERKLRDVIALAYSKQCRQEWILRYFGETEASPCGSCDNCLRGVPENVRKISEDELTEVRKALSCVARMSFRRGPREWTPRFGKDKTVKCACGSRDATLATSCLDKLSTYGILKEHGKKFVSALFDSMLDSGLLEITGDEYPLISLTPLGAEVMLGEKTDVCMEYPAELSAVIKKAAAPKSRAKTSAAIEPGLEFSDDIDADKLAESTQDFNLRPKDAELYSLLCAERDALRARNDNIPAYMVFPNLVLKKLAALRPRDAAAAMRINGIGKVKAEKFLPGMLDIIAKNSDNS